MKILATQQLRKADAYTIEHEPVSSVDLMERAAIQLFHAFISLYPNPIRTVIFAGPGNNGGDGIALARMLAENSYPLTLNILDLGQGLSADASENVKRLPELAWLSIHWINEDEEFTIPESKDVVVDALFGSGLTRPLNGFPAQLVNQINSLSNKIIAIDIPSGLFGDDNSMNSMEAVIHAKITLSLHCPKLSFFMPEHEKFVGQWKVLPIGLDKNFIESVQGVATLITEEVIRIIFRKRGKYDHKGQFGHALLVAGTEGKMGAAALAAEACLRSGVGLLTCHVPDQGTDAMQVLVPEAMLTRDSKNFEYSALPDLISYSAIGIGPGFGTGGKQLKLLADILEQSNGPLVLDADALNILAANPELLEMLPAKTILTPHPGEYKRLFGEDTSHFSRLERLKRICHEKNIIVILKGAHTSVVLPDQKIWFNSTGNPGMATAGSGDALTGIVLSLLAQGYSSENAAILAVFLHGLAGDQAVRKVGEESLIARDIVRNLGDAFIKIL